MYFITTKRMLEVCFSAHPNIQYRTFFHSKLWKKERFMIHLKQKQTTRSAADGFERNIY